MPEYVAVFRRKIRGFGGIPTVIPCLRQPRARARAARARSGEAGEIAAELEKAARQDRTRRSDAQLRQRMLEEAEDVLWNLTRLIDILGSSLPEVAESNLARLHVRYRENGITLRQQAESVSGQQHG
ncbi:hypothetical protein [Saccharopolyspora sp. NPDC050642]|uniref:hypothetical protein n=1 Tax=Saccharopolyspora sp. NPDC050642 TaxID=3157099 RepID=UPI003401B450